MRRRYGGVALLKNVNLPDQATVESLNSLTDIGNRQFGEKTLGIRRPVQKRLGRLTCRPKYSVDERVLLGRQSLARATR